MMVGEAPDMIRELNHAGPVLTRFGAAILHAGRLLLANDGLI
jgi:hypothetical protein